MKILVYGSRDFEDYSTFMRAMIVSMDGTLQDGDRFEVLSGGPFKINNYTAGFMNSSENFLKQKGIKSSFRKILIKDIKENLDKYGVDKVIFFTTKNNKAYSFDSILMKANDLEIENVVYKV